MKDTTLPSDNPLIRTYYILTAREKIKTINNKIEQNKAQYSLDKQLRFQLYRKEMLANMNF